MIRPFLVVFLALATLMPLSRASTLRFSDATEASGVRFTMTSGKMPSRQILEVNGGGVALFDYDQDDDLDLFLANGATIQAPENGPGSRMYANRGDGTFEDVTSKLGIQVKRWAMGVAVGDYDGDGQDDLYITCYGSNILLRNDVAKSGRFVDETSRAGVGDPGWGTSAAFGDLDADGDLDLYVVNYLEFDAVKPPAFGRRMFMGVPVMDGPAGLTAQQDLLYENRGDGTFKDVSEPSGCRRAKPGYGLGVVIFDMDNDGKLDLFVGNDSTENFLFRNLGGLKFKEIGVVSGIASNYDGGTQATMGIALADVDGNGFADVFTTNFSSDTNTLHLNRGQGWFDDRTSQYGLGMVSRRYLSWGTRFHDFDSDGDEDLFIASGHVYPEAAKMGSAYEQPPLLFERRGKRFHIDTEAGPMFTTHYSGRSAAFGDLDGDGDVDVVMTTLNGRVRIFRNDSAPRGVVVVELRTPDGSRHAEGAVVEMQTGDSTQRRWIGGGSYQSVDAPVAYFGLGDIAGDRKSTVRVHWSDAKQSVVKDVLSNSRLVITQGASSHVTRPLRAGP